MSDFGSPALEPTVIDFGHETMLVEYYVVDSTPDPVLESMEFSVKHPVTDFVLQMMLVDFADFENLDLECEHFPGFQRLRGYDFEELLYFQYGLDQPVHRFGLELSPHDFS